ncbi:MAG: spermidine/putrescine ABC transporter substrate-binding protein [Actinomycetota bacterium]
MSDHDDITAQIQRLAASSPQRRGHITRRDLLRRMGVGVGALSVSAFLAACGVEGTSENNGGKEEEGAPSYAGQDPAGELSFANWPLYIDRAKGKQPTIEDFQKETGITVDYKEVIDDNESFFGTIREPLANGQSTGWDLIVVTDWLIAKMIRLGYLEKLDHEMLKQFEANAGAVYKDPSYDPGNAYSVPWQSGITGIGYNPKLTKREITSFEDLFDPAFKGKVGMFTEMRDTMNLTLLGLGVDPQDATAGDAEKAAQKLTEQRDAGIVRDYYGNNYADALAREDLWLTMAWSGDVFQLQFDNPDLQFVVPEEGGILWVDNMAIPKAAEHPVDAHMFMDYVYDPEVAAQITAWVNYICPVPAAQDILKAAKDDYTQTVANSPLVFPTPDMEARLYHYKDLDEEEEEVWNELFGAVIQG